MVEDLITQDPNHLKRLPGSNRVDEHVAVNANEMLRVQDAVFILDRRPAWGLRVSPSRPIAAESRFRNGELPDQPYRLSQSRIPDHEL